MSASKTGRRMGGGPRARRRGATIMIQKKAPPTQATPARMCRKRMNQVRTSAMLAGAGREAALDRRFFPHHLPHVQRRALPQLLELEREVGGELGVPDVDSREVFL